MKKLYTLLLILAFCSCGSDDDTDPDKMLNDMLRGELAGVWYSQEDESGNRHEYTFSANSYKLNYVLYSGETIETAFEGTYKIEGNLIQIVSHNPMYESESLPISYNQPANILYIDKEAHYRVYK